MSSRISEHPILGEQQKGKLVTFTYDGKELQGYEGEAAALMCEGLGVDAIGFNCGLGPVQVGKLLPQMLAATSLPVIINPNAGLPVEKDGKTCFEVGPEEYAELMYVLAQQGPSIVGGCCGTTPAHIEAMIKKCKDLQPGGYRTCQLTAVSSYGKAVHLGEGPVIIGERINPTGKKRLKEALVAQDLDYVCRLGLEQINVGAHILDVNVGTPGIDEPALIAKAVPALLSSSFNRLHSSWLSSTIRIFASCMVCIPSPSFAPIISSAGCFFQISPGKLRQI